MIGFLKAQKIQDTALSMMMTSVFWVSEGAIHIDFRPHSITINAQHYSDLLCNNVHEAIRKKRPGILKEDPTA
jgi:hypothetical protein